MLALKNLGYRLERAIAWLGSGFTFFDSNHLKYHQNLGTLFFCIDLINFPLSLNGNADALFLNQKKKNNNHETSTSLRLQSRFSV